MKRGDPLPETARILLIRTSSLGDVIHALPVLRALRRARPQATIGWVVEEPFAPLLAGHPDLDELISVALRPWGRRPLAAGTWRGVLRAIAALRRFRPDVVFDLMGNHKAAVIARLSGCRRRIGLDRRCRREPASAVWLSETVPARRRHAVDRGLDLLAAVGLPAEAPADFGGDLLLRPHGGGGDGGDGGGGGGGGNDGGGGGSGEAGRFAVVHAGAGWGNKVYPAARWGQAARALYAATGVRTLVTAGPGEEALAAAAVAAGGQDACTIAPAPDLPSLAALLRGAALAMGGDTGPMHLAHALGTPVLMLMGPTDPQRHGPYGAPERVLVRRLPCSFCHRRFDEAKACLLEILPEQLAARAATLLGQAA